MEKYYLLGNKWTALPQPRGADYTTKLCSLSSGRAFLFDKDKTTKDQGLKIESLWLDFQQDWSLVRIIKADPKVFWHDVARFGEGFVIFGYDRTPMITSVKISEEGEFSREYRQKFEDLKNLNQKIWGGEITEAKFYLVGSMFVKRATVKFNGKRWD